MHLVTRLENVDDRRRRQERGEAVLVASPVGPADTLRWRPLGRPSAAVVVLYDDGLTSGETLRVRGDSFAFGRTEGDLLIPHDDAISGRHAELVRERSGESWRWILRDLKSRNGTFARIAAAQLFHGAELIVGTRRLKFELPPGAQASVLHANTTREWYPATAAGALPTLRDVAGHDRLKTFQVARHELRIGADEKSCDLVIEGDPYVSPYHARIHRDQAGVWWVENNLSLNGTWLRVEQASIERTAEFQIGEQRFSVRASDGSDSA